MRAGDLIGNLNRALQAAEAHWQNPTVTPRQFMVLRAIADMADEGNDKINQHSLTVAIGMDRSTLADVMRRLESRKLVKRRRSREDRRNLIVCLTPDGRDMLNKTAHDISALERWILSCVHSRHHAGFVEGIHSLAKAHGERT